MSSGRNMNVTGRQAELDETAFDNKILNAELGRLTQVEVELATCKQELAHSMQECDESSRARDKAQAWAQEELQRVHAAEQNAALAREEAIAAYEDANAKGRERDAWIEEYTTLKNAHDEAVADKEAAERKVAEHKNSLWTALNSANHMKEECDGLKAAHNAVSLQAEEASSQLEVAKRDKRRLQQAREFTQEEAELLEDELNASYELIKQQQAAYQRLASEKAASEKRLSSELAAAKYELQAMNEGELALAKRLTQTPKVESAVQAFAAARPCALPVSRADCSYLHNVHPIIHTDTLRSKCWETGSIYTSRLAIGCDVANDAAAKWRKEMEDAKSLCNSVSQDFTYGTTARSVV